MGVEKAYYWPPEYLPMTERDSGTHLFMNGGVESSDDSSIAVIAGQAWGGGGTFFTSSEYQACLDRVCHRMGASTEFVEHNFSNKTLSEGARKLGYSHKMVPQNTGGNKHYW